MNPRPQPLIGVTARRRCGSVALPPFRGGSEGLDREAPARYVGAVTKPPIAHLSLAGLGALLLATLGLTPGCGGLPRAPANPSTEGLHAEAVAPPAGMEDAPPAPLSLHPGDVVALRLQSAEVTSVDGLTVDSRGVLHVPLAGDVDVRDVPLSEAERRVEAALQRFDRTVRVGITLEDPQGQQATVVGAVNEQGRFRVVPGMRLADLYATAGGGVTSSEAPSVTLADLHLARLVRGGQALPVSLALALQGDPRHNVRIQPGDQLFVPAQLGGLISVVGEVRSARVIIPSDGLRLSQAVAMAGGYSRDANYGDIRIVRGPREAPVVYRAALDHIAAGEHPDPVLAPGDIVLVGSSALADFRDGMGAISGVLSILSTAAIGLAIPLTAP